MLSKRWRRFLRKLCRWLCKALLLLMLPVILCFDIMYITVMLISPRLRISFRFLVCNVALLAAYAALRAATFALVAVRSSSSSSSFNNTGSHSFQVSGLSVLQHTFEAITENTILTDCAEIACTLCSLVLSILSVASHASLLMYRVASMLLHHPVVCSLVLLSMMML